PVHCRRTAAVAAVSRRFHRFEFSRSDIDARAVVYRPARDTARRNAMRLRAAINPLLLRRGGRDTKKKFPFQCGADGVVAHRNIIGERPPRLRHFGSFAPFVYWRSLPSSRGGEYSLLQPELGAATIYFVMFTIVILGFLVMATDVGRMYLIQGELQTAADAAALASAMRLVGTANAALHASDLVTASFDSTTGNDNRFNLRMNQIGVSGGAGLVTETGW